MIREEHPGDSAAIHTLTCAAFAPMPFAAGTEARIIDRLRTDGDLTLSLVAEADDGAIVGHVAFSPAFLSTGEKGWFALGPIAVDPGHQGRGIGRKLVETGCATLRDGGAKGVVLLGNPKLYSRFDFATGTPLAIDGPHAEFFQVLAFSETVPAAKVGFAPAFAAEYGEASA